MDILMSLHYVRIYRITINSQVTTVLLAAISQEVPVFFDSWPLANTGSFIPILKNCYLCGGSVGGVVPHTTLCKCRGQRTALWSQCSPSPVGFRIKLRSLCLCHKNLYQLSHLAGPFIPILIANITFQITHCT